MMSDIAIHKGPPQELNIWPITRSPEEQKALNSALLEAARGGDLSVVMELVRQSADPKYQNEKGCAPLHNACGVGDLAMVEFFLQQDARIEARTSEGMTPLIFAALQGNPALVDLLLRHGAVIDGQAKNGMVPLMCAAAKGHVDAARSLTAAGAEIEHRNHNGQTALMIAAYSGAEQIVRLLVERGAIVNKLTDDEDEASRYTALFFACQQGHFKIVEFLLQSGANPNLHGSFYIPLLMAIQKGYGDIVSLLLRYGADFEVRTAERGQTALFFAVILRAKSLVEELLKYRANVDLRDNQGETPLMVATYLGDLSIVELLLGAGVSVNYQEENSGHSALLGALFGGHRNVAKRLIEAGACLDVCSQNGYTPALLVFLSGFKEFYHLFRDQEAGVRKEIALFKMMNTSGLGGTIDLNGRRFSFPGSPKALTTLCLNHLALAHLLPNLLVIPDQKRATELIRAGKIVCLPCGYPGHVTVLVFGKKYMAFCDRSAPESLSPIYWWRIDPRKFSIEIHQQIMERSVKEDSEGSRVFYMETLPLLLFSDAMRVQDHFYRRAELQPKKQKAGNCTVAAAKAAWLAVRLLLDSTGDLQAVRKKYKEDILALRLHCERECRELFQEEQNPVVTSLLLESESKRKKHEERLRLINAQTKTSAYKRKGW